MKQKATLITLDLAQLRTPNEAHALVDLVEHGDLDTTTLQQIRDAAAARLTPDAGRQDVETLRIRRDRTERAMMRAHLSLERDPTVRELRQHVQQLCRNDTTKSNYDEKQEIVRMLNFWRRELGLQFSYNGTPCTIRAYHPHPGDKGGYRLAETGTGRPGLYARYGFPPMEIQQIDRGR